MAAFVGAAHTLRSQCEGLPSCGTSEKIRDEGQESSHGPLSGLGLHVIDMADWSSILQRLQSGIKTCIPTTAEAKQEPFVPEVHFNVEFTQQDVLAMSVAQMTAAFQQSALATLMFTLNELYNTSIAKTTNLLLTMTLVMSPGTHLLVVDSPGSYSTVELGKNDRADSSNGVGSTEKKYPMQWMLDHTLLETSTLGSGSKEGGESRWRKVVGEEAIWFRRNGKLRYPINLEDMRYQMHLYEHL